MGLMGEEEEELEEEEKKHRGARWNKRKTKSPRLGNIPAGDCHSGFPLSLG
jgi:hypothetical protein